MQQGQLEQPLPSLYSGQNIRWPQTEKEKHWKDYHWPRSGVFYFHPLLRLHVIREYRAPSDTTEPIFNLPVTDPIIFFISWQGDTIPYLLLVYNKLWINGSDLNLFQMLIVYRISWHYSSLP